MKYENFRVLSFLSYCQSWGIKLNFPCRQSYFIYIYIINLMKKPSFSASIMNLFQVVMTFFRWSLGYDVDGIKLHLRQVITTWNKFIMEILNWSFFVKLIKNVFALHVSFNIYFISEINYIFDSRGHWAINRDSISPSITTKISKPCLFTSDLA